jgi:hypothetical protein
MTTKHPDLLHPSTRATLDRLTRTENEIDDLLEGEPSDETTDFLYSPSGASALPQT